MVSLSKEAVPASGWRAPGGEDVESAFKDILFIYLFIYFSATPMAYASSTGAAATSLHHSHSNARSPTHRGQGSNPHVLMDARQVHYH